MNPTLEINIKVIKGVLILNLVAVVVLLIVGHLNLPILFGLLFGSVFSILNFRLLSLSLEKALTMPPHKAQVYAVSRYMIRITFISIVIIISLKAKYINVIGTMIGLILPSLTIKFSSLLSSINKFLKRKEA